LGVESEELAAVKGRLLPGIAGICLYLLVVSLIGVINVLNGTFAGVQARYTVLPVCTMLVVGVFGLLRLRRWGWALVVAGTLLLCLGYIYMARSVGQPGLYVMAGLDLCMFLYLVRTEVRERLI
jgi:hypothetical protein